MGRPVKSMSENLASVGKIKHDIETRSRIKVGMLMHRLTECVEGKVELSAVQVQAAQILLRKALPDLTATQISGDAENPLRTEQTIRDERAEALKLLREYRPPAEKATEH
jgi:hypothetical protein